MEDYSQYSDEQIQQIAAAGTKEAENYLAYKYLRFVRLYSKRFHVAGFDNDDISQEGMLGLLQAIRRYDITQKASFKTFAEICIHNRINSVIKSASRNKQSPLNDSVSLEAIKETGPMSLDFISSMEMDQSTEEQYISREHDELFLKSFTSRLSAFENSVLKLYLAGFSYSEISNKTGKNEKAIDNAVQRIRHKFKLEINLGEISFS